MQNTKIQFRIIRSGEVHLFCITHPKIHYVWALFILKSFDYYEMNIQNRIIYHLYNY